MKFALLALSLVLSAQAFAKDLTCEGATDGGQMVSIALSLDDANTATSLKTTVDGTELSSFTGEQLMSEPQDIQTEDGGTISASLITGTDQVSAMTIMLLAAVDEQTTIAVSGIVAGDVVIEQVVLSCQ